MSDITNDVTVETVDSSVPAYKIQIDSTGSFWRRAWFVISAIPHYLFTGSVKLP